MSVETQLIQSLSDEFTAFQNGTINVSALTNAQANTLKDKIFPRISNNGKFWSVDKRGNTNLTAFEIGDVIREIDDVNKVSYVGRVLNPSLTLPADFNDSSKIELYNQDGAAI